MKATLAAVLILAVTLHAAERKEDFPDLMPLKKDEAVKVARKQAADDFAAGRYRLLVFGLRKSPSEREAALAKEGVEVRAIAGCVVSEGIVEGAQAYNEVMREKLKTKLGRDIFSQKNEAKK